MGSGTIGVGFRNHVPQYTDDKDHNGGSILLWLLPDRLRIQVHPQISARSPTLQKGDVFGRANLSAASPGNMELVREYLDGGGDAL